MVDEILPEDRAGTASRKAAQIWWVTIPVRLRCVSPLLSAIWADGIYLSAWPKLAAILPPLVLVLGIFEGATHWSFHSTMWQAQIIPQRAASFAQIRPLLFVAAVIGPFSAQLGFLLVAGFALGDWFLGGSGFSDARLSFFWHFLQIGVPQLISYLLFFMLAVLPVMSVLNLIGTGWTKKISGHAGFWAMALSGAALQGFMVSAWTYAAPMAIRPVWMWVWHGEFPPLTVSYFSTMVDPWLPALTIIAAIIRAWLTWRVRQNPLLKENAVVIAAAFAQPNSPTARQFLPFWANALLAAMMATVFTAGYMASFKLGLEIFLLIATIFLTRVFVLSRMPGWKKWMALMAAVPLLFRWLGVGIGTYLVAYVIYLRPGSATVANEAAGSFAPELAGIVLGFAVLALLMPAGPSDRKTPMASERFSLGRLKGAGAAICAGAILAYAEPASAAPIMMQYCADSWCCFTSNHNAILAISALVLLVAALFLLSGPALLTASGEAMSGLATGAMFGSAAAGQLVHSAAVGSPTNWFHRL